jgi:hypothetical protein
MGHLSHETEDPASDGREPGHDLVGFVPDGRPSEWRLALIDGVVSWDFLVGLTEHQKVRPWLVLAHHRSLMGPVGFAVPRLAPESGWEDLEAYQNWRQASWTADYVPLPPVVTVAEAALAIPRSPTRPRWANPERLVDLAIRSDLKGHSSARIVADDGESDLPTDRARGVRKELTSARGFLAAIGALPWAAFDSGPAMTPRRHWWEDARFMTALASWRRDATNLSWRAAQEQGPAADPAREAATTIRRSSWGVATDDVVLAHARGVITASANEFAGTIQQWLESLIGFPGQTPECHADLVYRSDLDGSARELRELWTTAKASSTT